ncbi:unnamed protein product [Cladocopium goreaui]|uniref:Uncharacterized protein n=1 Tax=Cladocopium goreaui TaxID=2562237 RepID=A0A9P1GAN9_9DINO|nr:unnamed protein product [Cladocopium goreaui]
MATSADVKRLFGKFADHRGLVERAWLLRVVCGVAPMLSARQVEILFSKLLGTAPSIEYDVFVDAIFAQRCQQADPGPETKLPSEVILRAVTTRSDWQLPLALAPLREQLEVLGAKAPVSVIMEMGSEAYIAVCNAELKELCRAASVDRLLQELKSWKRIPDAETRREICEICEIRR